MGEEVEVLLRMTQTFAKLPEPQPRPLELAPLLAEVCALYSGMDPVDVELSAGGLSGSGDADPLRRGVGNLVKNTLEASRPGGAPVRVEASAGWGRVRITVRDHGAGLGRALEGAKLMRSLGKTKAHGSGLGLPIAYKIVQDYGGALRLLPADEGEWMMAVIELPAGG